MYKYTKYVEIEVYTYVYCVYLRCTFFCINLNLQAVRYDANRMVSKFCCRISCRSCKRLVSPLLPFPDPPAPSSAIFTAKNERMMYLCFN